jgi:competence protein ComFB
MLRNYMEELINIYFPLVSADYKNVCKCKKCTEDIKAIALNHLQTLYVVTDQGEVYSKINELGIQ